MTQEEKELLLKDLCARLPYGVKAHYTTHPAVKTYNDDFDGKVTGISIGNNSLIEIEKRLVSIDRVKPYLRPMSSMTEEEMDNFQQCLNIIENENYGDGWSPAAWGQMAEFIHYCNEHHLDYNGLIAMGLALKAPNGMYD